MKDIIGDISEKINALRTAGKPLILAIDGRCASGKTTLARLLEEKLGWTVFHMDDYFPRPEQRTAQRLAAPGGNVDYERFLAEVMLPLTSGAGEICFRPFDCHSFVLKPAVRVKPGPVTVVEGSYSCHPELWNFYDMRVFLTTTPEEQLRRIAVRNGEDGLRMFIERWIPMEERYFETFDIIRRCEAVYST